jgi:hypothetical protein
VGVGVKRNFGKVTDSGGENGIYIIVHMFYNYKRENDLFTGRKGMERIKKRISTIPSILSIPVHSKGRLI